MSGLKPIAVTLLASLHTRLALLANELQTERHQALSLLWLGLALTFCLVMALVMMVLLAVVVWWQQRTIVLAAFAGLFLMAAIYFHANLKRLAAGLEPLFAASLSALEDDVRVLNSKPHESQAG